MQNPASVWLCPVFARLNQKRNKKRYRITMFSVAMGMVMFMTCYGLNRTIQYILRVQMAGIYDVRASVSAERYTAAEGLAQIRKSGMFTDCYVSDRVTLNVDCPDLPRADSEKTMRSIRMYMMLRSWGCSSSPWIRRNMKQSIRRSWV